MDPAAYRRIVVGLEDLARHDHVRLQRNAVGIVVLGYAFALGFLLIFLVAAAIAVIITAKVPILGIKLLLPMLLVQAYFIKSLWVKTQAPDGFELKAGSTPELAARVEEIRASLDAPRADVVLFNPDFNASVTQIPRLGIFGFPKTYLILGAPLMAALEKRQLDAVLAHEFAHLSRSHPKLGIWMYRMSATWGQLNAELHTRPAWVRELLEDFIKWYAPRLQAYGLVLSRENERQADADAARICGADAMAEALVAMELRGRWLRDRFWPGIWRQAEKEPAPPGGTWLKLPTSLTEELPTPVRAQWLGDALERRALDDDTHPALRDRLQALGVVAPEERVDLLAAKLSPPVHASAASHYLGPVAEELFAAIDRFWYAGMSDGWRRRHAELRTSRERSSALLERERNGATLDVDEMWELTCAIGALDGDEASKPHLQRVLAMGDHAGAHYEMGRMLLASHDASGVEHLRTARERDARLVAACNEQLRQFFANRGDVDGLLEVETSRHKHEALMRRVAEERATVPPDVILTDAGLKPEDIERMRRLARLQPKLSRLWVARVPTKLLPERPLVLVFVKLRTRWSFQTSAGRQVASELMQGIQLSFACDLFVNVDTGDTGWIEKKMNNVPGSLLFAQS